MSIVEMPAGLTKAIAEEVGRQGERETARLLMILADGLGEAADNQVGIPADLAKRRRQMNELVGMVIGRAFSLDVPLHVFIDRMLTAAVTAGTEANGKAAMVGLLRSVADGIEEGDLDFTLADRATH